MKNVMSKKFLALVLAIALAMGSMTAFADETYSETETEVTESEVIETWDAGEAESESEIEEEIEVDDLEDVDEPEDVADEDPEIQLMDIEDEEPEVLDGWYTDDKGNVYYYVNGVAATGLTTIKGSKYYFDEDGVMQTGWQVVDESGTQYKYYFMTTGEALTDGWYVITSDGVYVSAGKPTTVESYQNAGKYVYYFNASGRLHLGWRSITESGTVNKYYTKCTNVELSSNEAGMVVTGLTWINGQRYYFNAGSGRLHYGWRTDSETGYKYYFNTSSGSFQTGCLTIIGKKYFFNTGSGRLHYGWRTDSETGYKYYCDESTGVMQTGWVTISGKKYFFNTGSGRLHYGWRTDTSTGNKYYCDESTGVMKTGYVTISGVSYYFDSNGVLVGEAAQAVMVAKAQSYTSSTKWLILVNNTTNRVGIFYGSKGNWELKYYWKCSTGKASTPTVKGTYTVTGRGISFSGTNYTCWYYTQFYGNYLFHSVLYAKGSKTTITDGRLGQSLSHGCVRLSIENAKWIYDNIPNKTKVVSYS